MERILKLSAIKVANQLDIKGIKTFLEFKPLTDSSSELFYSFGNEKFQYYFNYGVIAFCGYTEEEIKHSINSINTYLKGPDNWLRDDQEVRLNPDSTVKFEFGFINVDRVNANVVRIAMFNLAQSVALDHYHQVTENLLIEIKGFTNHLEQTGKLNISRKNMMKFIGRALNTQNDIADNIYIFDAPDLVWDDEYLNQLQNGLMKHFDLRVRFSEIEYTMRIIEDNLSVFREITHQRESNILEWIIIALILVEVFDLLLSKLKL